MLNHSGSLLPVAVVIVNYNAGHWLFRSVSSALSQAEEVIVVDNASEDSSVMQLEPLKATYPQLTVHCSTQNDGFGKACNRGAKLAKSPYVLFLNPDCELQVGAIHELLTVLQTNAQCGMVGGVLTDAQGTEQRGGRRQIPTLRQAFCNLLGLSRFFGDFNQHQQPLPQCSLAVEAISGAMMLLSREMFLEMGGFDEHYFMHCEDLDLCMRLHLANKTILFVPSAKAIHAQGVCSRARPIFVLWHKHKGMSYFYQKFYRAKHSMGLIGIVVIGIWARFVLNVGKHYVRLPFLTRQKRLSDYAEER